MISVTMCYVTGIWCWLRSFVSCLCQCLSTFSDSSVNDLSILWQLGQVYCGNHTTENWHCTSESSVKHELISQVSWFIDRRNIFDAIKIFRLSTRKWTLIKHSVVSLHNWYHLNTLSLICISGSERNLSQNLIQLYSQTWLSIIFCCTHNLCSSCKPARHQQSTWQQHTCCSIKWQKVHVPRQAFYSCWTHVRSLRRAVEIYVTKVGHHGAGFSGLMSCKLSSLISHAAQYFLCKTEYFIGSWVASSNIELFLLDIGSR